MYVTGQGIWHTDDAAEADADKPTHWVFRNHGLEETVARDFVSPPSGPQLYSVVGDICGFRHDDVTKSPERGMFQSPIFGNGTGLDFAWSNPDIVVRVGSKSHGEEARVGALSKDGGVTWTPFETTPEGNQGSGDVTINADGTVIMWAPKSVSAHVSTDGGKTWVKPQGVPGPAELPDWAFMNFKPAADRVNPQKIYAYDAMAGIGYYSIDAGRTFKESASGLPTLHDYELSAADIASVPGKEGHVWLATGKELYRSVDGGATYTSLDTFEQTYAVGFGKAADGRDYPAIYVSGKVGETFGIFRSVDDGANWVRVNDDQHQFSAVDTIAGDPRIFGRVYVGTHGRGILYGDPK